MNDAGRRRQRIDIGDTTLEVTLAGRGSVTVIFENGLGTSLEEWDAVAAAIAARARTLCYDRRRAPQAGPVPAVTAVELVNDLSKLLTALHLTPPYVVVGHSWGGVVARTFAHAHPSDVAGLVLVDATHEALDSAGLALLPPFYAALGLMSRPAFVRRRLVRLFSPAGAPAAYRARVEQTMADRRRWRLTLRTARGESAALRPSLAALRRECPELPQIPVEVLTARATGAGARSAQRVHAAWRTMVDRAAKARLTEVPTSSHLMPLEAPEAVSSAILRVLDAVESGLRLPQS